MPSLPELPTELLIEIVKYYPELLLGTDASLQGVPSNEFSGNDTLRALSQTCRTLRGIFLPVLWERVQACFTVRNLPQRKISRRAKILERRMTGIQKTPYVLPYIHSLTVTMQECGMENCQPIAQFVRVLQLLPNLKSLSIFYAQNMAPVLLNAFRDKIFPSVVSLSVADQLSYILPCFPNIQTLTAQHYGGQLLKVIEHFGVNTRIHTLNNLCISSSWVVERLREAIPRLKQLSIWHTPQLDILRLLEGMDSLSDLRIRYVPPRDAWHARREPALDDIIAAAKRILRASKATGRKELRIQHLEGSVSHMRHAPAHPSHIPHIIKEEQIFIVSGGQ